MRTLVFSGPIALTLLLSSCGGGDDAPAPSDGSTAGSAGASGHGGNGGGPGAGGAAGNGGKSNAGGAAGNGGTTGTTGGKGGGAGTTGGKGGGAGTTGGKGGVAGSTGGQSGAAGSGGGSGKGGGAGSGIGGNGGVAGHGGSTGGDASGGAAGASGAGGSGPPAAAVLAFPVTCPGPGFDAATVMPPLVLSGTSGMVISGVKITNPDGPCIHIDNSQSITIRDSVIGPCKGNGIEIGGSSDIHVENSFVSQTGGDGVSIDGGTSVTIERSCFEHVSSGVYALDSTGIVIENNAVKNVQGPIPRGQLTQFDKVSGQGNRIRCNVIDNVFGDSDPEDNINLYQSNGTPTSPILVEGNRIRGGGPSTSGGGILLGDGGVSSWQVARGNVLVDPGQYGVAIASGENVTLDANRVLSAQKPWSNVGLYVWNQYDSACGPLLVTKNVIDFTNKDGQKNDFWDSSKNPSNASFPACTGVTIAGDNDFAATLSASMLDTVPAGCP